MRVGLIHDWLITIGGAEKVLEALLGVYPSDIHTLVTDKEGLKGGFFEDKTIHTSFIQKLPFAKKKYRSYLPLFPLAIEQFDLSDYDVVISSSHSIAKGVLTHADQLHVCYCHTPMRYAWDLYHEYLKEAKLDRGPKGMVAKYFLHRLRMWDAHVSTRVDAYIANSGYIAKRILKIYGKEAKVIYPPVDISYFSLYEKKENFFLTASRLVSYKKIDLIVEAFAYLPSQKLVVIGDGPEMEKIRAKATKNVEILGYQSNETLRSYMQKAKAFLFAALEDFGILPVEAQSCGTPVIAFGKGGALETVKENETGIFFKEQTVSSIIEAIHDFGKKSFDPKLIRLHAETFALPRFQKEIKEFVEKRYCAFKELSTTPALRRKLERKL